MELCLKIILEILEQTDIISGGCIEMPKNATTSALESLRAILNFIYCWIKRFHHNYQVI